MNKLITIDAKEQILGRLASRIALILMGKNSSDYAPNKVAENKVKVINVSKIKLSGNKESQKVYKKHTMYLGHLKVRKYGDILAKNPDEVLRMSVKGMLPKNRLLKERIKNLITEA